jgi:hypothetical protein
MTPLLLGQQHQINNGKGRLCIHNGNDAIAMRAAIAIGTTAKMPAHQWQQCNCNKGSNAIAMMARTPAH